MPDASNRLEPGNAVTLGLVVVAVAAYLASSPPSRNALAPIDGIIVQSGPTWCPDGTTYRYCPWVGGSRPCCYRIEMTDEHGEAILLSTRSTVVDSAPGLALLRPGQRVTAWVYTLRSNGTAQLIALTVRGQPVLTYEQSVSSRWNPWMPKVVLACGVLVIGWGVFRRLRAGRWYDL